MDRVHSRLVVFTICVTVSMSSSASVTTFANGKSVTHKSSSGVSIAFPDVCKTPPVPTHGPIPIPYPDIAMSGDKNVRNKPVFVLYSFDVKLGGQVHIRQSPDEATSSVTEVTYVDTLGKEIKVQEPTLIELTSGEYCGICVADGKVTAIYRLLPIKPKRKKLHAPRQKN